MISIPPAGGYSQTNKSDKDGSLFYTINCTFDEDGYLKLSDRMVKLMDQAVDPDFNVPVGIGHFAIGEYLIMTTDRNWNLQYDVHQRTLTQNTGTNNPQGTVYSHASWFKGLWHAATSTTVVSRPQTGGGTQNWTSRITGLTASVMHKIISFVNRNSIVVLNGEVAKQYDSSYINTVDLTIPSDFTMVGGVLNGSRLGIITRLASDGNTGQDQEAVFITWDGSQTSANAIYGVGSDGCVGVVAYKSSFVVLTRTGELLYFNGGGFDRLAAFPFYFSKEIFNSVFDNTTQGIVPMRVEGDLILMNIGVSLDEYGMKQETMKMNIPSGVYCYDPAIKSLYHRASPSMSQAYVNHVPDSGVDISTNIITTTAGVFGLQTLPETGNVMHMTEGTIGGLVLNNDYFIIKLSSTTFKLALTKEKAFAGDAIDITSIGSSSNYFWSFDIVDFGNTAYTYPGDVNITRETSNVYGELITGARLAVLSDGGSNDSLCVSMPFLENRGFAILPKIFSIDVEDIAQKDFIKFRPLKTGSSIIVYVRTKDVYGLPVTGLGTWTGTKELYTSQNISEAKDYLDTDLSASLMCYVNGGAGAGTLVKVESIGYNNGIYSLVLEEDVIGATTGRVCTFGLQNWEREVIIDDSQKFGYQDLTIGESGKFTQFMLEMRGNDITIEQIPFVNKSHKLAK